MKIEYLDLTARNPRPESTRPDPTLIVCSNRATACVQKTSSSPRTRCKTEAGFSRAKPRKWWRRSGFRPSPTYSTRPLPPSAAAPRRRSGGATTRAPRWPLASPLRARPLSLRRRRSEPANRSRGARIEPSRRGRWISTLGTST